jgi:hypothetical protein
MKCPHPVFIGDVGISGLRVNLKFILNTPYSSKLYLRCLRIYLSLQIYIKITYTASTKHLIKYTAAGHIANDHPYPKTPNTLKLKISFADLLQNQREGMSYEIAVPPNIHPTINIIPQMPNHPQSFV